MYSSHVKHVIMFMSGSIRSFDCWKIANGTTGNYTGMGVTTSRATSGAGRNDRNTSGQQENKFNTSYGDISVVVAESNSVVKPKCEQYTSLNKM